MQKLSQRRDHRRRPSFRILLGDSDPRFIKWFKPQLIETLESPGGVKVTVVVENTIHGLVKQINTSGKFDVVIVARDMPGLITAEDLGLIIKRKAADGEVNIYFVLTVTSELSENAKFKPDFTISKDLSRSLVAIANQQPPSQTGAP